MDVRRFRADLYNLATRACVGDDQDVRLKVFAVADILVNLYRKNLVKINHSALELICARSLIKQGYGVKVEHRLDKILVCDVMGERGDGAVIVEIETGFIPPEAALEPSAYARTRVASKIARYSPFAGKFALGTTPSYVLDIPEFFVKPPRARRMDEAAKIKELTDMRYTKPPISVMELMQARLHMVLLIDVDSANTHELDPETYVKKASEFLGWHRGTLGPVSSRVRGGFNISESAGIS
ncbi:MAG TPA: hypothetical protein VGR53_06360 [Nitrososphaerales archaeon]|nr:hypothetical protein [Nitrososphaerales archaeon]